MTGLPFVLSVPEAGRRYYGLGRDASYAAVERGEIPNLKIGRRVVVPIHQVLKQQGMSDDLIALVLLGTSPKNGETGPATGPATDTTIAHTKDSDHEHCAPDEATNATIRPIRGT